MADSYYINFEDSVQQDLKKIYGDLCTDLNKKLGEMSKSLDDLCQKTQYLPFVNVVNETVKMFNDNIKTNSNTTFDGWIEGDGSFTAIAEKMQVGSEGVATAQQMQRDIKDIFDAFWTGKPMGQGISLDTSKPKLKDGDFDELKGVYTKYSGEIETINESTTNKINQQGQDDPTYSILIPAVNAITGSMKSAFEQFVPKIDEAKAASNTKKNQQINNNTAAAEVATNTSASAADIAAALKMYSDI